MAGERGPARERGRVDKLDLTLTLGALAVLVCPFLYLFFSSITW